MVYERIEPEGRCVSPDGHGLIEEMTMASRTPEAAFCPNCGKKWTIVTFDDSALS